jgi:hypothetical protein
MSKPLISEVIEWCIHVELEGGMAPDLLATYRNLYGPEPAIAMVTGKMPGQPPVRTSLVIGLDLRTMNCETLNSIYRLSGPGRISDDGLDGADARYQVLHRAYLNDWF